MALRGTLKDFGIADIFQLIGHQAKTGTLTVRRGDQNVKVYFSEGNVVRAESATRKQKQLLGSMLLRAEAITEDELAQALKTQSNTLMKLGEILVKQAGLDEETLKAFTKLQTTETIYGLFLWDSGTYEFEAADVQAEESELIRSENVLMEGFRQVDEWPAIRKKITSYGMTFFVMEDLGELLAQSAPEEEKEGEVDEFEDAFAEFDSPKDSGKSSNPRLKHIGDNERLVFQLITQDRDVQKIIDLARLGEFETCKALVNLIDAVVIEPLDEGSRRAPSAASTVGGITSGGPQWTRVALRASFVATLVLASIFGVWQLGRDARRLLLPKAEYGYLDLALQTVVSRAHIQRIHEAIQIYRLQKGNFPDGLATLVSEGLLVEEDLRFPWQRPYHYSHNGSGYQLLRPLY